ncbi:MAG: phosphate ABC transporter substrate-binding protein [Phycisphaerales bacterium]|nr:phosphate ABC transporter substrate-binding protein [Phycisphaerales bacterium]
MKSRKFASMMVGLAAMPLIAMGTMMGGGVDPELPTYEATSGVSGSIKSIGSDTMNNLMTLWGEDFKKFYPATQTEVEGKGSSTAPAALIEGQSHFGPMSRPMKGAEMDKFEEEFGYPPTPVRTAIDCLAVYVHKDCPLDEISIEDLTRVYSVADGDLTWGDLGVNDPKFKSRPINLYGRNSASGTYGYFKKIGLQGNDYKASVKEQPGSSAVVQAVTTDLYGLGYSGIGYKTAGVKALSVSYDGYDAVDATAENAYSGEYPIARFLYLYVNADPTTGITDPLRAEFIKMVFSQSGQEIVVKDGYFPVPASIAREDLEALKIGYDF